MNLRARAYAKINLFLHITGKRQDGYHLLTSLLSKISLHDDIIIESGEILDCCVLGLETAIEDNLVLKAAKLLRDYAGLDLGAKIIIDKKIPVGAGLGGGSADAATALKLLVKFWNIQITQDDLYKMSLMLGADVPFCMQEAPCMVSGIGEVLSPIMKLNKNLHILMINPGYQISTKDVFDNLHFSPKPVYETDLWSMIINGRNDLEDTALEICPNLIEIKELLSSQDGAIVTRMSGSGATFFSIFDNYDNAKKAFLKLRTQVNNWKIWLEFVNL
jgi:4-diphosphocytidyl-2-C-methyl-D-erythritol kinase